MNTPAVLITFIAWQTKCCGFYYIWAAAFAAFWARCTRGSAKTHDSAAAEGVEDAEAQADGAKKQAQQPPKKHPKPQPQQVMHRIGDEEEGGEAAGDDGGGEEAPPPPPPPEAKPNKAKKRGKQGKAHK